MAKKSNTGAGKMSISDIRSLINKKSGQNVAYNLTEENPSEVTEWIPTGARWLDSIICRGRLGGIPVGRVTEIAGLEATGKSFLAAQVAANAQKQGRVVVYFDSENAISPEFWELAGINVPDVVYVQTESVEKVLERVEDLLANFPDEKFVFIWDSLALTPSETDIKGDFNPLSSMAVKPRILSKGMSKLVVPLANAEATFLVLNQLKTNITSNVAEAMTNPYFTPGGKAMHYTYSLRIFLTARKGKASFILDDHGYRVGNQVKCKIEKSRFGTQGRICEFKIMWGGEVGVQDEESWLEAIKSSDSLNVGGAWYTLTHSDGTQEKFQKTTWMDKLKNEKFRTRILELIDEEVILKFDKREGVAEDFYEDEEK